jgi:hypothetical protein
MSTHYNQGPYFCDVTGQQLTKTKNGNPQFELDMQPYAAIQQDGEPLVLDANGPPRTIYMVITEKSGDFVLENLRSIGFAGSSFSQLDADMSKGKVHSFVGQRIRTFCNHETYEGVTREKWMVSSGEKRQNEPLDTASVRKLDALFGKQLKNGAKSSAPAAEKAAPPPAEDHALVTEDDDIPFSWAFVAALLSLGSSLIA